MTEKKQGAGAVDEARTRFPASREWHSHSQEPCLTSEFDALRAGRGSEFKPARIIPKTKPHPFGWGFVFVIAYRFCCPHSRPPQGRGSVRGKPLRVSPLAFNHPPAGDRFCAAKSPLQKNTTTQRVVVFFWSGRRGSNSLPRPWQGRALPDELRPQTQGGLYRIFCGLSTLHFRFAGKNQNQGPKALSTPSISPPRRCFQCWDRSSPSSPSCPVRPAPAPRSAAPAVPGYRWS